MAVHGLFGDPYQPWTAIDNGVACMWLKDVLPKHVAHVRVMVFNYDCSPTDSGFVPRIKQSAKALVAAVKAQVSKSLTMGNDEPDTCRVATDQSSS